MSFTKSHQQQGHSYASTGDSVRPTSAKNRRATIAFQLLLLLSLASSIILSNFAGFLAGASSATLFCLVALFFYSRTIGFEARALFLSLVFYALSWFFLSARFLLSSLSFFVLPLAALAFAGLLVIFRFFVYNRSGEGEVAGRSGEFLLVEVFPSAWHSFSGVQVLRTKKFFAPGSRVRLRFSQGLLSQPRVAEAFEVA